MSAEGGGMGFGVLGLMPPLSCTCHCQYWPQSNSQKLSTICSMQCSNNAPFMMDSPSSSLFLPSPMPTSLKSTGQLITCHECKRPLECETVQPQKLQQPPKLQLQQYYSLTGDGHGNDSATGVASGSVNVTGGGSGGVSGGEGSFGQDLHASMHSLFHKQGQQQQHSHQQFNRYVNLPAKAITASVPPLLTLTAPRATVSTGSGLMPSTLTSANPHPEVVSGVEFETARNTSTLTPFNSMVLVPFGVGIKVGVGVQQCLPALKPPAVSCPLHSMEQTAISMSERTTKGRQGQMVQMTLGNSMNSMHATIPMDSGPITANVPEAVANSVTSTTSQTTKNPLKRKRTSAVKRTGVRRTIVTSARSKTAGKTAAVSADIDSR